MAYQTLPNTFVSGAAIASTAVSANFMAALVGYQAGTYDGNFSDLAAKQLTINTSYGITSGGTATVGKVVCATATVTGDVVVSGDVYRTAWTTYAPAPTNMSVTAASGYYRETGKLINAQVYLSGKMTSDAQVQFSLPSTAGALTTTQGWTTPLWVASAGAVQQYPAYGYIAPDGTVMTIYPAANVTSFTSSTTYIIWGDFAYERA